MSASRPERGWSRAGEHEEANRGDHRQRQAHDWVDPGAVVEADGAHHQRHAADDAVEDDRGPAHLLEPITPPHDPGHEDDARADQSGGDLERAQAAGEQLIGEPRIAGSNQVEQALTGIDAEGRVDRDPRRREQPDVGGPEQGEVASPAVLGSMMRPCRRVGRARPQIGRSRRTPCRTRRSRRTRPGRGTPR